MLVRKPVENEQTLVWKRIAYKLDLNSIYPNRPPIHEFTSTVVRTGSSPNFKRPYYFVFEGSNVYFLTSVDRPALLRLNVYLNSTIPLNSTAKPTLDTRKYTRVFDVKEDKSRKTHLFQLKSSNSLEEILKSEKAIVDSFNSKLWNAKPTIAYIKPNGSEFEIGLVGAQRYSDLLDEFCFLGKIPNEHLKIASLNVNHDAAECNQVDPVAKQPVEDYVVNAYLTVGTKEKIMTRFISPGMVKPVISFFQNLG